MQVYNIQIDERQLHYIRTALREFVANNPVKELDEFGFDIPTMLVNVFAGELAAYPCLNGFAV
jgi:hypothetical protein